MIPLLTGKVFIHGKDGVSRSATFAIAYLMMRRMQSALQAVRTIRYEISLSHYVDEANP